MTTDAYAGLDVGSTGIKLLIIDGAAEELLTVREPTPWTSGANGTTEIFPADLSAVVGALISKAAKTLDERGVNVRALAIAGMGETGVIIDDEGSATTSGFAWFDPRGSHEIESLPAAIKVAFAGRTGLPLGAQVSVAKLLFLKAQGHELADRKWLNLPEYVAFMLGGDLAVERSLISRTGLLDQDSVQPWEEILQFLGVDSSFVPEIRTAGSDWGAMSTEVDLRAFSGAKLTVAGHDHLVAAEASGGLAANSYHVSMGTAEVLLRVTEESLGREARTRLADFLINDVQHVVPGKRVLVAGVKSGLIFRRLLQSLGVNDRAGRDILDEALMAMPYEGLLEAGSVEISGARNDDGVLRVEARADGLTPAEVFAAALRHSNDEISILIDAMNREVEPATSSFLSGGWSDMRAVVRAREQVLPDLTTSTRVEDTAYGAALVARKLITHNS